MHPDYKHYHAFRGVNEIYIPKHMLQGGKNAGQPFHHVVYPIFYIIWDNLLAWFDDYLIYAKRPHELLDIVRILICAYRKTNFKLHALKCDLFTKEVVWCGPNITSEGITFEPRGFEELLDMPNPTIAAERSQFMHAANWMRGAIPDLSHMVAPLNGLLKQ